MKIIIKYLILLVFICLEIQSYGQLMLDDINLERIQQRTIRKYVECEIKDGKHQFSEIHPSWNTGKDLSSYRKREKIFFLNSNLQDVWQGYVSANPSNIWSSRKISFGLLLRKFPSHIFYNHDPIMGADTGQVYYLNLKLMLGICNLAVAFEIITLDTKKLILEFSYIEGNKSTGVQQVRFIDVGGGRTEIIHTSYFKSGSHFRDKWLYPYFHNRFINEFHRNMRRLLKLNKQNENKEAATNI